MTTGKISSKQEEHISSNSLYNFELGEKFAKFMDDKDPLKEARDQFLIPELKGGNQVIYMAGNSLGLQPLKARDYIDDELTDWADLGVEGHFEAKFPWLPYHENLTSSTAKLVGALDKEVVVMNSLTVNLHLMMVSFYRPQREKYKILIENQAFPSDQYAVVSQARLHGFEPNKTILELKPRENEEILRTEDIINFIEKEGESIALIMLGSCNYLTGQAFDIEAITKAAHKMGCLVGFNLAHGAGNLVLKLHDWNVDFAVWCSYKYLNAGPGAIAGCFVHERHANSFELPRLAGWWGHDKKTRFEMSHIFKAIEGAEGWQLSNPPIFQLASLRASMEIFDQYGMINLRKKADLLTGYLEFLLKKLSENKCQIVTPTNIKERGSQLSIRIKNTPKNIVHKLKQYGAVCDFREPDIVRAAPVPLYNSFEDVYKFATLLAKNL